MSKFDNVDRVNGPGSQKSYNFPSVGYKPVIVPGVKSLNEKDLLFNEFMYAMKFGEAHTDAAANAMKVTGLRIQGCPYEGHELSTRLMTDRLGISVLKVPGLTWIDHQGTPVRVNMGTIGGVHCPQGVFDNMSFVAGCKLVGYTGSGINICDGVKMKVDGFFVTFFKIEHKSYVWYFDDRTASYVVSTTSHHFDYADIVGDDIYVCDTCDDSIVTFGERKFNVILNDWVFPHSCIVGELSKKYEGIMLRINGIPYKFKWQNTFELVCVGGECMSSTGTKYCKNDQDGIVECTKVGDNIVPLKRRYDVTRVHADQVIENISKAITAADVHELLDVCSKEESGDEFVIPSFENLAGSGAKNVRTVHVVARERFGYCMRQDVAISFASWYEKRWLAKPVIALFKEKCVEGKLDYMGMVRSLCSQGHAFNFRNLDNHLRLAGCWNNGDIWYAAWGRGIPFTSEISLSHGVRYRYPEIDFIDDPGILTIEEHPKCSVMPPAHLYYLMSEHAYLYEKKNTEDIGDLLDHAKDAWIPEDERMVCIVLPGESRATTSGTHQLCTITMN